MKYRLIASDFDDTLLRSDGTISEHTKEVIRDFESRGGIFFIDTGRMMPSILKEMKRVGFEGIVVGYAGALILDTRSGEVLYESMIPTSDAADIAEEFEALSLQVQIYVGEELLVNRVNEFTAAYEKACDVTARELGIPVSRYLRENNVSPYKVLAFAEPDLVKEQVAHINAEHEMLYACYSKPYFIEVMRRGTDKARAIRIVAEKFGIPIEQTVAVGDSNNDVPMIAFAGLGAAVANAGPEAKAAADVITDSNDDEGVANLIRKYGI